MDLAKHVANAHYELTGRKPSETLFKAALQALGEKGIGPGQTLHVGSSLERDIGPAKPTPTPMRATSCCSLRWSGALAARSVR